MTRKTKKVTTNTKKTTTTMTDPDIDDQAVTGTSRKRKLILGSATTIPKKPRGTPTKLPQTEEQIVVLVDKLKDHTVIVWTVIPLLPK